jgi:thiol-disulfide isomerase/thioredoxin
MRHAGFFLAFVFAISPLAAQQEMGPTNEKARKTYQQAEGYLHQRMTIQAFESFKKADKQDDGQCRPCQRQIIKLGMQMGEWKAVETAAEEFVAEAQGARNLALAHQQLGVILMEEGVARHKEEPFERAHEEMTKAIQADPNLSMALYNDGLALAHMNQDAAAKAQFERYIQMAPADQPKRQRALLFISQPEMARAKMAPPFSVTTLDGQHIALDDLKGKVVLVDFWATWCGPCREALPHIRKIARKFQGQPLVILSVSLDTDERKWRDFVAHNGMTWLNCRDGGFNGAIAKQFGVDAIPHTFTIDADGVLQDEHVGDAAIEGKLKKQIARARELQAEAKTAP